VADADVLFAVHRQGVYRYLCRIVAQAEMAHDLTQEVFLRVSRSGVPATDEAGRRAWVFKIARNLALNHLRDDGRRVRMVELAEAARPPTQELAAAINEALASLQPLDRDVFLMRETAGLSYAEIASACEITVEAVRARLHRARMDLRKSLDGPMRAQTRLTVKSI
jgi:RNA polymerase sigma-70 factor (ECF subfamily)